MSMITKPASIEKNSAAEITLDISVLAAVASVAADAYFSDSSNWSEVLVYFRSSEGNQREILKFDATQASPTANFLVSDKARDAFEVQKIVIKDFDNDSFTVTRSELVVADFDIDMGAILPFYTIESGVNDTYSSINSIKTNIFFNSSNGQYESSRVGFSYTNIEGVFDNQTYRFRFYISSLTVNGTDFYMTMTGYSTPVTKTGVEILNEFNTNGYIEFEYLSSSNVLIGPTIGSPNYGEASFSVSKIEIYPI